MLSGNISFHIADRTCSVQELINQVWFSYELLLP